MVSIKSEYLNNENPINHKVGAVSKAVEDADTVSKAVEVANNINVSFQQEGKADNLIDKTVPNAKRLSTRPKRKMRKNLKNRRSF